MAHRKGTEVRANRKGDSTFTKDKRTGKTTISRRKKDGTWKDYSPKKG